MNMNRRKLLVGIGTAGTGLILSGCSNINKTFTSKEQNAKEGEVTAVEDLMREHGILRRILFVYSETASKMHSTPSNHIIDSLHKAARLFQIFGEDYHEKALEEAYIFPAVKKAGGHAAGYPDILVAQHSRGREITNYILTVTETGESYNSEKLASAMESFVRMYRPHAAREDTVVFPAWKSTFTAEQLDKMGEKFEAIEHQQFGEDGFENAVRQIEAIENELGLADLSQFTAPPAKT